ncbi:MAG TPA: DUF1634 domain-containing protein [Candidatus Angelobacter sp.]|nr:DUF1634 domain-containing protein [Candidatus Angelobacter sp.]
MKRESAGTDRALARTLKIGAYSAFGCIVVGLALHFAGFGDRVTTIGMIVLLATPVLRIIVAGVQFLREHDIAYVLVSLGVLGIIALAYVLGLHA